MKAELTTTQNSGPNPVALIQIALEKGADISQLKELMDLQERWEKKEARKNFFDALSNFQRIVPVLKKKKKANINSQKGVYSYKYADLASIVNDIRKPLSECGLSYRWEFQEKDGKIFCKCLLSHRDGHTEITEMEGSKDDSGYKNSIQQTGSTQTYLQRYTLIGALGLATADEDSDGKQPEQKRMTVDEIAELVSQSETRKQLNQLFARNKDIVNASDDLKAKFKAKEQELKESEKPGEQGKIVMP